MHRRAVLTGAAGVTGLILLPGQAAAGPPATDDLGQLLAGGQPAGLPAPDLATVATMAAAAQAEFSHCRYRQLAVTLPHLIGTAVATRDLQPPNRRPAADLLVCGSYLLAAELLTKLHANGSAATAAAHAVEAARASGEPRAVARAKRRAAIVLRRTENRDAAVPSLLAAAHQLAETTSLALPGDANLFADILCTAAYTASLTGDPDTAYDLLTEAQETLTARPGPGFGVNDVTLYQVGIARAAGDFGIAVAATRQVRLDLLPSPERHARFWEDTALAWWGRGNPANAFQSMLRAEYAAPQEVRYRPWALQLTEALLSSGSTIGLSRLPEFAGRIGVS